MNQQHVPQPLLDTRLENSLEIVLFQTFPIMALSKICFDLAKTL